MKKNRGELRITLIILLLAAVIIIPIIIYGMNSLPVADDYSQSNPHLLEERDITDGFLKFAIRKTASVYMGGGGAFFSYFADFYITPIRRWGLHGVRIANSFISAFFYISMLFYVYSFNSVFLKESRNYSLMLFLLFAFNLNNNGFNTEVYTHYINMVVYILPLSVMMVAHGLLFRSIANDNRIHIASAVLGFLVGGGMLNIVVLNCGLAIIALYLSRAFNKGIRKPMIMLICSVIGGIINVLAPGNFVRRDLMSKQYTFLEAIFKTIIFSLEELELKLTHSLFPICFILVIFLTLNSAKGNNYSLKCKHPLCVGCLFLAGIFLVNFPVVYGAGVIFDRGIYVQDITIYILSFMWGLYFCGWLIRKRGERHCYKRIDIGRLCAVLMAMLLMSNNLGDYRSMTTPYMIGTIANGELARYVEFEEGIINEILQSKEKHVYVRRDEELSNPFFINLGSDLSKYFNRTFYGYVGKPFTISYGTN